MSDTGALSESILFWPMTSVVPLESDGLLASAVSSASASSADIAPEAPTFDSRLHCKLRHSGRCHRFSISFPLSYGALREACEACGLRRTEELVFRDDAQVPRALTSDSTLYRAYYRRTGETLQLFTAADVSPLSTSAPEAVVLGTPVGTSLSAPNSCRRRLAAVAAAALIFGLGVVAGEHTDTVVAALDSLTHALFTGH